MIIHTVKVNNNNYYIIMYDIYKILKNNKV